MEKAYFTRNKRYLTLLRLKNRMIHAQAYDG